MRWLAVGLMACSLPAAAGPAREPGQRAVGGSLPSSVGRALPDRAANWTRAAQIQMFNPGDLWEHIDGAAEQYLTYGFQDLATTRYSSDQTRTVVVAEVYRMQHRQMLDQVLELFQIKPEYDLDLMREGQSMAQISAGIFTHLDPILEEFKPDWVLAVGDTTTVVTTSLLAFYRRIKFGHIEAGLRTHNKWHPFPEESNRRLATVTADLHFAPTEWSQGNLLREGVDPETIHVTGNPVIDALNHVSKQDEPQEIIGLLSQLRLNDQPTSELKTKHLILVTAHRRENFGEPIENIYQALQGTGQA